MHEAPSISQNNHRPDFLAQNESLLNHKHEYLFLLIIILFKFVFELMLLVSFSFSFSFNAIVIAFKFLRATQLSSLYYCNYLVFNIFSMPVCSHVFDLYCFKPSLLQTHFTVNFNITVFLNRFGDFH